MTSALPPCLADPDHLQKPEPADGKGFAKAGGWWYCPKTGYAFAANGFGFFEGLMLAANIEDGDHKFIAQPNCWLIRERPGHPLRKCPAPQDALTAEDLTQFLREMWNLNQEWATNVLNDVRKLGAVVVTRNVGRDDKKAHGDFEIHPKYIKVLEVYNYSKDIEDQVRMKYVERLKDPRNEVSKADRTWMENQVDMQHEAKLREHERLKHKAGLRREMDQLTQRYSKLKEKAQKHKFEARKVDDLLESACKDRKMASVSLTKEILDEVEASLDIEIEILEFQDQQTKDAEPVEEDTSEKIEEEKMPQAFRDLIASARKSGLPELQILIWLKQIGKDVDKYSDEALDILNKKVATYFGDRAEKELMGEAVDDLVEETLETTDDQEDGLPDDLEQVKARALKHCAGLPILDIAKGHLKAGEHLNAEFVLKEFFEGLDYGSMSAIRLRNEVIKHLQSQLSADNLSPAADTKQRRTRKTDEEKAAEAAEKERKAAEKAAKKAESDAIKAEKESIKLSIEDGLKSIEKEMITNRSTGEVKSFNQVTRQFFDLTIKQKSIELEIDTLKAHAEARLTEVKDHKKGFDFCYLENLAEPVREQFKKQMRTKTLENGTKETEFRPATVKTQHATFYRNPVEDVQCVNKGAFAAFLRDLKPGEAAFYGSAFEIDWKVNVDVLRNLIRQGIEIPGWVHDESLADPIGVPTMKLTCHIEKPSVSNSLKNDEEESGDTLDDSETDEAA